MNNHTSKMNNSNNSKQPEALRLAVILETRRMDDVADSKIDLAAADEIRRLYAEVDRLSYQLAYPDNFVKEPEQEPVYLVWLRAHCAWMHTDKESFDKISDDERWMLYTSPPARKPLTDEEIEALWDSKLSEDVGITALRKITQAIEAAHGIKGDA